MSNENIRNNDEEWDKPEVKESHPGKTLQQHVNEIEHYLSEFLKFYDFPELYHNVGRYIAKYHDYGKLNKKWSLYEEDKPDHSPLSVRYLRDKRILFDVRKDLTLLLWYLIYKHHSPLTKNIKNQDFDFLISYLIGEKLRFLDRITFEEKVNITDTFGLFKIADVLSAENKEFKIEKPIINEEIVKMILTEKGKKSLDIERFEEQKKLYHLPDIGVLRAYTGWGKTDSALMFFKDKDPCKIFYLFPTITAINKFYDKLSNVIGSDKVSKYFYFYDVEAKEQEEILQDIFFAENFLNQMVITTIDQFILSFLQVGKYYKKRVMFRKAGIILDEVHVLNPVILSLFIYFIKKFRNIYNFKVLFMSATLNEALKNYLQKELDLDNNSFLDLSYRYKEKRRIVFDLYDGYLEQLIDEIVEKFRNGKKVLVIANTVEKSIKIAEKLVKLVGKQNVLLIHARFMYKDRKKKEEMIENFKNKPHILVSTQVCEVSLDVSYDYIFTEIAPLSSLIQRFGRVNRYGMKVNDVNVKIVKPEIKDERFYPYLINDMKIAREIIDNLRLEKLENEYQLLKKLDELYPYEEFVRELEREIGKRINIGAFENYLKFFFSLDLNEKELSNLLSYRDSFTTLVIPHPDCVNDIKTREELEKILKFSIGNKNYANYIKRKELTAKLKELSVPIPVWWLNDRKIANFEEKKSFPVVIFRSKVYDDFYGLKEISEEEMII